jgi:ferric-dicitrate binding protein FerR (iron transport regulator)
MKLEVTRDVVRDLWPLCRAGEASPDSKALVNAFLEQDSALASTLSESERVGQVVPAVRLSPDAERRLLDEASARARLKLQIIGGSIAAAAVLLLAAFGSVIWLFLLSRPGG